MSQENPRNIEAEESLIGAALIASWCIEAGSLHVTAEDFWLPKHKAIWQALVDLHDAGHPTDPVTVAAHLERRGELAVVGGSIALVELQAGTPTISNAEHYARLVATEADRRRALVALYEAQVAVQDGHRDLSEILGAVAETASASRVQSSWDGVEVPWDSERAVIPPATMGARVDMAMCVSPGAVGLLIAPPESSKSMFAQSLCIEAALMGRHAVYIDLESRAERVVARVRQHIDGGRCRGWLHYIRPEAPMSTSDRWKARKRVADLCPAVVIIDGYNALLAKYRLDSNKTSDIAMIAEQVVGPWSGPDTCTLLIDHISKEDDRQGRKTAIGSIAKTGLVDYALAFTPDADNRIARGSVGWATITVEKDRDGELRRHCRDYRTFGQFTVSSDAHGRWEHAITMPPGMNGPMMTWRYAS